LHASVEYATLRPMPKGNAEPLSTVLYIRGTPKAVARKLKAAAALQGETLAGYVQSLLARHVEDLEKKGLLPKLKG